MRDEVEVALEKLLEPVVPGAEAHQRILDDRRAPLLRDGEDPCHQQVGPVAGVGGDLLAREVGFGDHPTGVVQQPMGGAPDHRALPSVHQAVTGAWSPYSRPSPASSSISIKASRNERVLSA